MSLKYLAAAALWCGAAWCQPAPLSGFEDKGSFHLYVNEDRIAVLDFEWKRDGSFEGRQTLSLAGQTRVSSIRIEPDSEGRWVRILSESPAAQAAIERSGLDVTRKIKEQTTTFKLQKDVVLYSDNAPALLAFAVRRYDRAGGGKQRFPLFIVPGVVREMEIEWKEAFERTVGGRDLKFDRWICAIQPVELTVWTGPDGRVALVDVPVQKAAFVREGFETLRKPPEADPLLSQPSSAVSEQRGVMAPMRDGVRLSTDIFRPAIREKAPVILVRTPYKKEMSELTGRYYARRGYACAIQDVRGRFASEGKWEPLMSEKKDGYDTVEWLAARPWSNGKVGMIGGSYLGWVQWWAAAERPPHLVTIIPNVAPPDPMYNVPYEYGTFFLMGAMFWAEVVESNATGDLSGVTLSRIAERKYYKDLRALPVIDLDKTVLGGENRSWREWIAHPSNDAYWSRANFFDQLKNMTIPVFHQSGWFDGDGIGTKLNYLRLAEYRRAPQKLVLGPWGHTDTAHRMAGDMDFGPNAIIDLQRMYLRWFDHYLKGADNGVMKEPLVKVFAMGSNKWLEGPVYPLPQTRFEKWYLAGSGPATTSKGDGKLTRAEPPEESAADKFVYDPGDPTPDPRMGDDISHKEEEDTKTWSDADRKKRAEALHETVTQRRKDILVYSSEPFEKPYTFVGPVSAVLYASTTARDTDWHMRLIRINKDGKLLTVGHGKVRARYRNSLVKPELLTPGAVYEYRLDLWHTGLTLQPGERLRIEVASAAFPMFSRNLNTGGHNEMETKFVSAEQSVFHNRRYPSHVILPVIPE